MILFNAFFVAVLAGTPVACGIGWWLWARERRTTPRTWRSVALFFGMLCASANVGTYWVLQPLAVHLTQIPQWRVFNIAGDVGIALILGALAGALGGVGKTRLALAACALLGFFLWLPVGVL